ncbi:MAG: SCP2 sterol-binding domain-containing protein [Roseibium sp.]
MIANLAMTQSSSLFDGPEPGKMPALVRFPLPLFLLQPILGRIVRRVAADEPSVFNRLGPHKFTRYVIDPANMPFVLELHPDPDNLVLRACSRDAIPDHEARISGKFFDLLQLVDCDQDGDAMFFSRGLDISGDTEAVVTLRNALDDLDGSLAARVANMFGPPGRLALAALRRTAGYSATTP